MPERGAVLLAIAREAIAQEALAAPIAWDEPWLLEPGASFVTLKLGGELRGCIGSIEPRRALGDDVAHNARAALHDSRFEPLPPALVRALQVEVSVLSRREPMEVASEEEALRAMRPGVDGIVLEYGPFAATFLPQVWESLPQPIDFLSELRRKARLPARFWHPDLKLSRYTVDKFQ